ncbi:hypothetical protein E6O75_ATG03559 [Venturia nashicola]|uniref:Uncharacterized protein n=1 Tax=Venturia nashicola TaxID=86259 RepID=A0A4Z1PJ98_9PEZI|nr:hypothetical protein E6O75_ATG03559 [Venturia nashicola]
MVQVSEKVIGKLLPYEELLPEHVELVLEVGRRRCTALRQQQEFAEAFVTVRKQHGQAVTSKEVGATSELAQLKN